MTRCRNSAGRENTGSWCAIRFRIRMISSKRASMSRYSGRRGACGNTDFRYGAHIVFR